MVILKRLNDVKDRLHNPCASGMVILDDSEFTDFNERAVVIRVEYSASEEKGTATKP